MNRSVAVKVLHMTVRDGQRRRSFENECARAGEIGEHAGAANIYRCGFEADLPYIVMRYYARGSLAAQLRSGQQMRVSEVLAIGVRIAAVLQFAHDLGVLHRDVKPENILCDAFGDPVLADFGIATDRDAGAMSLHHAMTPAYGAPEVIRHGGGWPVSDVWSLAATLYALLAGRPPFFDTGHPDPEANLRALQGPLPPTGRSDVPAHVHDTLARALIGEADARTASARRLADELNADLALLGEPAVPAVVDAMPVSPPARDEADSRPPTGYVSPLTSFVPDDEAFRVRAPAPARARRRRTPLVLSVTGVVLLIAVAYGIYAFSARGATASHGGAPGQGSARTQSPGGTQVLPAPKDVTVTVLTGSSVRISWQDTKSGRAKVVVSLGQGYPPQVLPDHSPQVITGLDPAKPYCFAVGYLRGLSGGVSYSAPTCIRGGVPGTN